MNKRSPRDEAGAGYVEYALLAALIAIVCLIAVQYAGESVSTNLSRSGSAVRDATGG